MTNLVHLVRIIADVMTKVKSDCQCEGEGCNVLTYSCIIYLPLQRRGYAPI